MEMTVPNILSLAVYSEYITSAKIGSHLALEGADINETWARLIYMERMGIQNRYNLNPSDPTLQGTANYLFSLLRYISEAITRKNNLAGALPVITGPANQSVTVGNTATFSVSVTSSTSVTYQWYANGVLIPGAISSSYAVTNAQLTQSGNTYFVVATNAAGSLTSNTATLTVTASLVASYYFGTTDYSSQLLANSDVVPYVGTFSITSGQPLSFTWPSGAANNQFIVIRYPATESVKTTYSNAPLNNGLIPSIAFNAVVTFGGFNYIFSRSGNPFSQNTAAPLIFS